MPNLLSTCNTESINGLENAERIISSILDGSASQTVAREVAFAFIAASAERSGDIDTGAVGSMTRDEASAALDRIESGRTYLSGVQALFAKYPHISNTITSLTKSMLYAESALIPLYLMANSCALSSKPARTQTYIVRHPITGLIKIGRSIDVGSRIKSLQTGAGAILSVIAVLDGDREAELHGRFSALRVHGEWFRDDCGEIAAFSSSRGAA